MVMVITQLFDSMVLQVKSIQFYGGAAKGDDDVATEHYYCRESDV